MCTYCRDLGAHINVINNVQTLDEETRAFGLAQEYQVQCSICEQLHTSCSLLVARFLCRHGKQHQQCQKGHLQA